MSTIMIRVGDELDDLSEVYGEYVPGTGKVLAVNRCSRCKGSRYVITHVPTGFAISCCHETQEEALDRAVRFWFECLDIEGRMKLAASTTAEAAMEVFTKDRQRWLKPLDWTGHDMESVNA